MLKDYFKPIPNSINVSERPDTYAGYTEVFPSITEESIVLLSLDEEGHAFRERFYQLAWRFGKVKWFDLGTLKHKGTRKNIEAGLTQVLHELFELNCFPILLSTEDYSSTIYKAYTEFNKEIEYCTVDAGLDLNKETEVYKILSSKPNALFNLTLLAYQSYYLKEETEAKLNELLFDTCRLGNLRNSIFNAEPAMRNAHLLSFNLKAIRHNEYPATESYLPNGLYAEEACQLMRFAGLSCTLKGINLHQIGKLKNHPLASELLAQMVWFFLQGRNERIYDIPDKDNENFTVYRNTISNGAHEITFCKSNFTERWWMEIPNPKTNKPFYVACTYNDFLKVSNDEMPDTWWKFYQKVM